MLFHHSHSRVRVTNCAPALVITVLPVIQKLAVITLSWPAIFLIAIPLRLGLGKRIEGECRAGERKAGGKRLYLYEVLYSSASSEMQAYSVGEGGESDNYDSAWLNVSKRAIP